MNNTGFALIGLATWAIVLTFLLVFVRLSAVRGGHPINTFDPAGKDLRGFGYRVTRVHGNTLENLAVYAAFLLYAIATSQTAVTEGLACWLLYARIGQSAVHLVSTSAPFVLLRANLFAAQAIICLYWAWQFWHA